jgi:zinc protease
MTAIDWSAAELPCVVERLPNGLTVIAHVERKSPIAAVYVGYRAGARDEPDSKAGLAHLCEHLMFTGTKTKPGSYFAPFEQAGASSINAFVREDYSAYFATVPKPALDFAMSMEADRMGNIADAVEDDRVERQRDIVINELRQRERQPYGCATRMIAELAHPSGHPYAHPHDGVEAELANISTEDIRAWFESRHSPARAILIVAGDVEPGRIIERAEHHFGGLVNKRMVAQRAFAVAGSAVTSRCQIELPVKHGRLCIAWNGLAFASGEFPALEAACEILAGTKNSRLWRRLVQDDRLATDVAIELCPRELGVLLVLTITARVGVPLSEIESRVREEIARLPRSLERSEVEVAHLRLFARMVRGLERVGGPLSRSDALGLAMIVAGSADSHRNRLSTMAAMQPDAVSAAIRCIAQGGAVLEMHPVSETNAG